MATRAEHRHAVLTNLGDAAVSLFETKGPSVTIDTIAERAGVSRRTVFRYVESKEDLAFIQPVLWLDVFEAGLATAENDEDINLAERLRKASRDIALYIDADPDRPRRAFIVAGLNPELQKGFTGIFQRWVDRIAAEVLATGDANNSDHRFRARIIGSAIMGMVDAVTREWVLSPPDVAFVDLYDQGFEFIRPMIALE